MKAKNCCAEKSKRGSQGINSIAFASAAAEAFSEYIPLEWQLLDSRYGGMEAVFDALPVVLGIVGAAGKNDRKPLQVGQIITPAGRRE